MATATSAFSSDGVCPATRDRARVHQIAAAIGTLKESLSTHPENGPSTDSLARAVLTTGLQTHVEGPFGHGAQTDMPRGIGGEASAPSPGWYLRASVASCTATVIAMRAAELKIQLDSLVVDVVSRSDKRGMLGLDESLPAGPLEARMEVRLASRDVDRAALEELVAWGVARSPIADALRRAIPMVVAVTVA